jgi:regulatory protein
MPRVTQVESQKKNPRRFNIFLDGIFAFGADEDTVIKFRLVPGKEINSDDLDKILLETEVGKLMVRMYGLFNVRQRSEKEVRDYLKNLNFKRKVKDQEEISGVVNEGLIQNLKTKGLLDDLSFARSWVESRRRSKKKGKNVLKAELFQKGIGREIIEEVLKQDLEGEESEEEVAFQALEKKIRVWKNLPELEFKKKATEFLIRRGFDYSVAKNVIDNFLEKR